MRTIWDISILSVLQTQINQDAESIREVMESTGLFLRDGIKQEIKSHSCGVSSRTLGSSSTSCLAYILIVLSRKLLSVRTDRHHYQATVLRARRFARQRGPIQIASQIMGEHARHIAASST
jgi:hypothetical protein